MFYIKYFSLCFLHLYEYINLWGKMPLLASFYTVTLYYLLLVSDAT